MKMAMTRGIRDLLQNATQRLTDSGIPEGRREAEAILAHALECKRLDIYRDDSILLDRHQQEAFSVFIQRRIQHEPLQYILGTQEFWGLEFRVTPDTFIPRPETELLIETAIESVPEFFERPMKPVTGIDLCTGTGCLAITLAKLYPSCRFYATDLSPRALEVARSNGARHGVSDRIEFLEGDLMEPLANAPGPEPVEYDQGKDSGPRFQTGSTHLRSRGNRMARLKANLIVCNPPYIPSGEIPALQTEVARFEPRLALNGGPDGLDYYRRLLSAASDYLCSRGRLFLEIGNRQADFVCAMALRTGWRVDRVRKDLAGMDRVIVLMNS
jgi:release factor glutamine methyltransferase